MSANAAPAAVPARVLGVELLDELRVLVRDPAALFFSAAMPIGFYALFSAMFGTEQIDGVAFDTTMPATFGAYAAVGVTLLNPGIGVAEDRARGWLRTKQVSAVPVATTLVAKVLATLPGTVVVLAAIAAVSRTRPGPAIEPGTWARLVAVLVAGALPFALLGLAVGFVASANATSAVLHAVLIPSAVASGLWMPLEILPGPVQALAPLLPTYHLGELALAQLDGEPAADHALVLAITTVVLACLAGLAYRRHRA